MVSSEVILNGNSAVQMTKDYACNEIEVPPVTAQQILARTRERKAKSTLLMAILDEHLARFHEIKDVKTLWVAIKTRFGDYSSQEQGSSSYADELLFSFFMNQSSTLQLDKEDLEQIDQDNLEEMGLKWHVAMLYIRVKLFYKKTERKLEFNGKEPIGFDKTKGRKQLTLLLWLSLQILQAPQAQILSIKVKTGLGYDSQFIKKEVLDIKEKEVTKSVFDNRSSDEENSLANVRFKKVFTRSGRKPVSAAKPKAAASTSAAKPVNTTGPKQSVNFKNQEVLFINHTHHKKVLFNATAHSRRNSTGHPQQALKNKGIVDSGCSRHMTGNKTYHADYQEINDGGFIAFGSSRGKITDKASIDESNLWYRRLGHVNFKKRKPCKRALVTKTHNKTPYELLNGRTPILDFMRPFSCPVTILNTLDPLGKFKGKAVKGFLVGYSVTSKAFREVSDQHYIMLPLWSSISSTFKSSYDKAEDDKTKDDNSSKTVEEPVNKEDQAYKDELDRLMSQEKEASDAADALRKEFEQGCMDQRGVSKAGNTNNFNIVSNLVNAASISGTFSADGPSARPPDALIPANTLLLVDEDDSQIPDLEDTIKLQSTGIFNSTYDDDLDVFSSSVQSIGTEADFNNMESSTVISPIPTHRVHLDHPKDQILGDPNSIVQISRMAKKSFGAHAFVYRNKKDKRGIVVRNKARLVAQGYRQEEGIDYDEVFAPMARIEANMIFLDFASFMDFLSTKWINMIRKSEKFSGTVTPLFATMLAQPAVVEGEGGGDSLVRAATTASLDAQQDSSNIAKTQSKETLNEPNPQGEGSSSGPGRQETIGGAKAQVRSEGALIQSSDPPLSTGYIVRSGEDRMEHELKLTDPVPQPPYDLPLLGGHTPGSDEGRPNINELMNLCNQFSNRVLALGQFKTAQELVIQRLLKKVKRLEKKQRARTPGMKLFNIGTSKKKTLDKENVSKQGRNESNKTEELNISDKGSGETEVFDNTTTVEKDVNVVEPVSTAGDAVNAASVIPDETRPRTTSVVIHDAEEEPRRATPPPTVQSQDKEQVQFKREKRIAREKALEQEAKDAALFEQMEDVQERIDADALLAERLQQEEREQFTVDEQAKINKPPTKAQLRNKMVTYLKHMGKYTHNMLKSESFEEIQVLYEREQKWINDFVPMDSEEDNDKEDDAKKEELRACLDIVPVDDIAIDVESLATKIMDTTKAQQIAWDDALVTPANHALKLTPFYNAFHITANVPEIYMHEFWAIVSTYNHSLQFKMNVKSHTLNVENFRDMLYICPRFPDYFMSKDQSISRRNKIFWYNARDDPMFNIIRDISRHQDTQVYSSILPAVLTNQEMLDSKAYKEYYDVAYGAEPPKSKTKYKKKAAESVTSLKSKTASTFKGARLKSKAKVTKPDMKKQPTKKTKSKDLVVLSEVPDEQVQKTSCTDEGTSTILGVPDIPPYESKSDRESWGDSKDEDDDDDDSENDDDVESNDHDDASDDERTESNNDDIHDVNLTNVDQTEYKEKEVDEETRTPSDDELTDEEKLDDEEQWMMKKMTRFLRSSDNEIASLMENSAPHATAIPELTSVTLPEIPNFAFVFKFDQRVSALETKMSELRQTNQFTEVVSLIPGIVDKYLASKMKEAVNVAVQLQTNKLREKLKLRIKTFSIRGRDDQDKDEYPCDGLDRGTERKKSGKDVESSIFKRSQVTLLKNQACSKIKSSELGTTMNNSLTRRLPKLTVTRLTIMKKYDYGLLEEIKVRQDDQQLYTFKEGDFKRLRLQEIEDMKRLMHTDELYKFSNGMLNDVRTALHDIITGLRMDYLPMRRWSNLDKKRAWVMLQDIDKQLYQRRLMRNLEKFVGGRPYGENQRLMERTI
uniref:Putative ribonuclease H-like domain-containing protein n=1 Tax=Tanacetum cinerariifolium TaxID=118510 RepID=A0A6L2K786_TANCI|nr:putative ribonuclease H-like domain-containing protein [Tanacetum cinerariifolium]